jgi:hypothetical protein
MWCQFPVSVFSCLFCYIHLHINTYTHLQNTATEVSTYEHKTNSHMKAPLASVTSAVISTPVNLLRFRWQFSDSLAILFHKSKVSNLHRRKKLSKSVCYENLQIIQTRKKISFSYTRVFWIPTLPTENVYL